MHNMKRWTLPFDYSGQRILLNISAPDRVALIDDYREVTFSTGDGEKRRAVFLLLPNKASNDPYEVKPLHEWTVPVQCDDPAMLYLPALDDEYVISALTYIFENGLEDKVLEDEDDISQFGG
jgi:hypothetical protein